MRPYVCLSALRALGGLIRRARAAGLPDVPAVARRLLDGRALVVGAMRRPPASTQLPPVAAPRCGAHLCSCDRGCSARTSLD